MFTPAECKQLFAQLEANPQLNAGALLDKLHAVVNQLTEAGNKVLQLRAIVDGVQREERYGEEASELLSTLFNAIQKE